MQVFGIVPTWRPVTMATRAMPRRSLLRLTAIANAVRPSAAEEARTIAASTNTGTLATLTADGDPWASFVTYGLLGGAPVLCVSNLAEHGRNLAGDPRASIAIVAPQRDADPLASGRVTLAGVVEEPTGDERRGRPRRAPGRRRRGEVLHRLQRLLAVGAAGAAGALGRRLRADGLGDRRGLRRRRTRPGVSRASDGRDRPSQRRPRRGAVAMAQALGGYPDTTAATCTGADRYGLDLRVVTPRGVAYTRIGYATPIDSIDELRSATVELTHRARRA